MKAYSRTYTIGCYQIKNVTIRPMYGNEWCVEADFSADGYDFNFGWCFFAKPRSGKEAAQRLYDLI